MADASESVAAHVTDPEALGRFARWSAEDVLYQTIRAGHDPARYTDAAVVRRAERDVTGDLAADIRLGFTHTPDEAQRYRSIYATAYLAAWRDSALLAELRERLRRAPVFIICYR